MWHIFLSWKHAFQPEDYFLFFSSNYACFIKLQQTAVPMSFLFPSKNIEGQYLISSSADLPNTLLSYSSADLPNVLLSYCFKYFLSILAKFYVFLSVFLHRATTNTGLLCPQHSLWEIKAARLEAYSPKLEFELVTKSALKSGVWSDSFGHVHPSEMWPTWTQSMGSKLLEPVLLVLVNFLKEIDQVRLLR